MTNIVCLYHEGCPDGFAAAWAVRAALGDTAEYLACTHGNEPPNVAGKRVIIVDFSFKRPILEQMLATASSITILDHHKTAQDDLEDLIRDGSIDGVFDMDHSGAILAWNWFHPGKPAPKALLHIEDVDLFRFAIENTTYIQPFIMSYPYHFSTWDSLVAYCENPEKLETILEIGKALVRRQTSDVQSILKNGTRMIRLQGYTVPAVNAPHTLATQIGNVLSKTNALGVTYYDTANERRFSLRSHREGANTDVSAIALAYGGGGHRNASGFSADLTWFGDSES